MVTSLDFENIVETIEQHFNTNWDNDAIPAIVPNVQKSSGTSGSKDLSTHTEFVRVSIFMPNVIQSEMSAGNIRKRISGFVNITHHLKTGKSPRLGYRALDTAKALFENPNTINGIVFRPGSINTIGEVDNFFQLALTIPFFVDTDS